MQNWSAYLHLLFVQSRGEQVLVEESDERRVERAGYFEQDVAVEGLAGNRKVERKSALNWTSPTCPSSEDTRRNIWEFLPGRIGNEWNDGDA